MKYSRFSYGNFKNFKEEKRDTCTFTHTRFYLLPAQILTRPLLMITNELNSYNMAISDNFIVQK